MTQLQIVNLALRHLGMKKLADLAGADPSTTVMLEFWDICVNTSFEEHQWSFANVQATLNAATTDVPKGWLFSYDYPTENAAAVWSVFNEATLEDKDAQDWNSYLDADSGDLKIATNLDEALCEYTYIVTDTAKWPSKFAHALSYFLAASACGALTGDAEKAIKLMAIYNAMLDEVQRIDSFKVTKKAKLASSYQTARG